MAIKIKIKTRMYSDIEDALLKHYLITGSDFFECYENSKFSTIRLAERGRIANWMVDRETGDIYYLTVCEDKLIVLNKLSLSYCMHDSPFHIVEFKEKNEALGEILIIEEQAARDSETRKALAKAKTFVTTL